MTNTRRVLPDPRCPLPAPRVRAHPYSPAFISSRSRVPDNFAKLSPRPRGTALTTRDSRLLRRREDDSVDRDIPPRSRAHPPPDREAAAVDERARRQRLRRPRAPRGNHPDDQAHHHARGLARALPGPLRQPRPDGPQQRGDDADVSPVALCLSRVRGETRGLTDVSCVRVCAAAIRASAWADGLRTGHLLRLPCLPGCALWRGQIRDARALSQHTLRVLMTRLETGTQDGTARLGRQGQGRAVRTRRTDGRYDPGA